MTTDESLQLHVKVQDGAIQDVSSKKISLANYGCAIEDECIVFDGTASNLQLSLPKIDFSKGFTIEAWVRYEAFNNWSRIIDFGQGQGKDNIVLTNYKKRGILRLEVWSQGQESGMLPSKAAVLSTGRWVHIAATLTAEKTATLYVNGEKTLEGESKTFSLPARVERPSCYIGTSNWGSGFFAGRMASLRFYNRALAAEDIRADMEADRTRELALQLHVTAAQGTIVDASPFVRSLEPRGGIEAESKTSNYLVFDGVDDCLVIPETYLDFSRGFTFAAWVWFQDLSTRPHGFVFCLLNFAIEVGGWPLYILVTPANESQTEIGCLLCSDLSHYHSHFYELETRKWSYLTVVVEPSDSSCAVSFYLNGAFLYALVDEGLSLPRGLFKTNYVGRDQTKPTFFKGMMAGLRLYNRALDGDEIVAIMEADRIPETAYDYSQQLYITARSGEITDASPYRRTLKPMEDCKAENGYVVFDGSSKGYLQLPTLDDLELSRGFTISAWLRSEDLQSKKSACIFSLRPSDKSNHEEERWSDVLFKHHYDKHHHDHEHDYDQLVLSTHHSNEDTFDLYQQGMLKEGSWIYVATVFGAQNKAALYVNGASVSCKSSTKGDPKLPDVTYEPNYVGKSHWGEPFKGRIAGLRFYNRALKPEEILEDMMGMLEDTQPVLRREMAGDLASALAIGDMLPAIEESVPLDFRLENRQGQHVLYTRLQQQTLFLEIWNTSRDRITLAGRDGGSKPDDNWLKPNHQLYLCFRPGTLYGAKGLKLHDEESWGLRHDAKRNDQADGFFLWSKSEQSILPLQKLSLSLDGVQVDGRGGSRGTRVELTYQNLDSAGSVKPLSGKRMHYLSVLDESPADEPVSGPIRVGFVGSNTFLNDGTENDERVLRLYNQSGHAFDLQEGTPKITITFPVASDSDPWGPLGDATKSSVSIENVTQSKRGTWTSTKATESNSKTEVIWKITSPTASTLENGGYIDVPITMKTSAPDGVAYLHVHYEGFSHLEDTVLVPLVKSPLVVRNQKVGIGTPDPCRAKDDSTKLEITGQENEETAYVLALRNAARHDPSGVGIEFRHSDDKKPLAFIRDETKKIEGKWAASLNFGTASADNQPTTRLTIDDNGNVGVGTSDPDAKLQVMGQIWDAYGALVPVGAIMPFAGKSAPAGWLMCDGSTFDKEKHPEYKALHEVIGETYGKEGKLPRLPDLQGQFVVGVQKDGYELGTRGGAEKVTLDSNQMPKHSHEYANTYFSEIGGKSLTDDGWTVQNYSETHKGNYGRSDGDNKDYYWVMDTKSRGGNESHENRPPYVALNYIIKY